MTALAALGGSTALAYAAVVEVRWFALRRATLPVLPPGHGPLRVLHVSDLHLTPSQGRKRAWVKTLAELEPDLVVNTGDNLAHPDSVPAVLDAFGDLLDVPGVFVFGSNDYFAPSVRNPVRYLLPDRGQRNTHTPKLPYGDLRDGFEQRGWVDLTNRRDRLTVKGTTFAFAGVDDPHLQYDDLASVAGPADPTADVRMGVTHAPYLRVLDQYAADGYETVLAGSHARRPAVPAGPGPGDQLRPRPGPRQGPAPAPRARARGHPRSLLAARLGRAGHLAVRAGAVLLPARGDPADAHRRSRFRGRLICRLE